MMPRQAAQPNALRDQHHDKSGELVQFPPSPDTASDTPGPDLGPLAAARIEHWCHAYDIPPSTVRALRAQGKGPKTFEIGRLIFCHARGLVRVAGGPGYGRRLRSPVPTRRALRTQGQPRDHGQHNLPIRQRRPRV